MATKRVLVLANSVKKGGRCVAGREVYGDADRFGPWIRPVSSAEEGTLSYKHYALAGGGAAGVLDVVEMVVVDESNDPGQPENWRLDENTAWQKVGSVETGRVVELTEAPAELWRHPGPTDRIPVAAQATRDPQSSLAVIQPRGLTIRLWREFNPWKGYEQKKTRARFRYRGETYDLSLTDPEFLARHRLAHPAEDQPATEVPAPCGDRCRLCVSLTPPLNGYHYKVVATVLEL